MWLSPPIHFWLGSSGPHNPVNDCNPILKINATRRREQKMFIFLLLPIIKLKLRILVVLSREKEINMKIIAICSAGNRKGNLIFKSLFSLKIVHI